jgi:hypothetical protein
MPIDHSDPRWRDLFANYGLTARAAQMLEKALLLLLAGMQCQEEGKHAASDLHEFLNKHKRKPVSQVIEALKKKLPFPPDLDADLQQVFKQRNDVIHHFFFDRFDGQAWARPPEEMGRELHPIYELLKSLQARVDALFEHVKL